MVVHMFVVKTIEDFLKKKLIFIEWCLQTNVQIFCGLMAVVKNLTVMDATPILLNETIALKRKCLMVRIGS